MIDADRPSARWFRTWCVATPCWLGIWSAPAPAAEFAWGAGYAVSYDSNITRSAVPTSDWVSGMFGGILYREDTGTLKARLLAQVERRLYARDTFPDDSAMFLDLAAGWTISPQRLVWIVEDIYREARVDLAAADTPVNRTDTNTLITGPDLTLAAGGVNSFLLGARYGRFDIRGPGDNQRYSGHARLLHRIWGAATVSLNYEAMVAYLTPPALYTKASREDLFGRYEMRESSGTNVAVVDLGMTRSNREGGDEPQDGWPEMKGRLARFQVSRRLTSESSAHLSLADQVSDTFSDVLSRSSFTVPTGAGDIYRSQTADLGYGVRGGRFGYTLQALARRVDYEQVPQDYSDGGARLELTWLPSVETRVTGSVEYVKRRFESTDATDPGSPPRTDHERTQRASLSHFLGRSVYAVLEGLRTNNSSSDPLSSFSNWRVMLSLGYSSGPAYGAQTPQRR